MKTLILSLLIAGFVLGFSSIGDAIRGDPDLLIFYSFDEEFKKEVEDESGNGFNAQVEGAEWEKAGQFGGALSLDGNSHIFTAAEIPGLTDTDISDFTVEHWVYLEANTGDTQQIWEALNAAGAWPAETFIEGVQEQNFYIYDTKGKDHQVAIPELPLQEWVHIAGTYDGTTQRAYLNGKQVGAEDWSGKFTIVQAPTGAIVIGKDNEADIQFWGGMIDEFAIYTRALSAEEIQKDMDQGVTFAVDPADKLGALWGRIKSEY